LDPGYYDDVGIVELQLGSGLKTKSGDWDLGFRSSLGGGLAYNSEGLAASGRPELNPFYFNGFLEGTARRGLGRSLGLGVRAYAGVGTGSQDAAKQRQVYFQGSDPLTQLYNPFLRSRGALLVGDDFNYHSPGGANVRAADSRLSTAAIVAINLELEHALAIRPESHLFNRVSLALFTDLAHGIGGMSQLPPAGDRIKFLADAGIGLRAEHRIGDTRFMTRFDVPLYLSRPEVGQHGDLDDEDLEFRWTFSFEPSF
ncbi:MAG TPA: hypothetical protein VFH26_00610, partial [Gemmatimonadales bacterium]|nr:hypothetical protein [Gemmatimonadales bacterium]